MSVLAKIRQSISSPSVEKPDADSTPTVPQEGATIVPRHKQKAQRAFDTLSTVSGSHRLTPEQAAILRGLKDGKSLQQCRAEYEALKAKESHRSG